MEETYEFGCKHIVETEAVRVLHGVGKVQDDEQQHEVSTKWNVATTNLCRVSPARIVAYLR